MISNTWQKSTYSTGGDTNCVEARIADDVHIRDTQNRDLGQLAFSSAEWTALLRDIRSGEL
ncbi:DUF397 domain-containing protein [Murinocardiopsis flavida]|uniref:DUF397 domain-containing protein n=1 Tax=Murinocardiopsis flavida TaxID=645275 RepID=UPI000D0DB438|nr:DUF397 domain-containing protein [Murinocardiopsis flavida]